MRRKQGFVMLFYLNICLKENKKNLNSDCLCTADEVHVIKNLSAVYEWPLYLRQHSAHCQAPSLIRHGNETLISSRSMDNYQY